MRFGTLATLVVLSILLLILLAAACWLRRRCAQINKISLDSEIEQDFESPCETCHYLNCDTCPYRRRPQI